MFVVADNLTISNPVIYKNLTEKNKKFFYEFFEKCSSISDYVDINLGQVKKQVSEIVQFIFEILYEVNNFKIIIDTINPLAIEECLKYCKDKPILNSFSKDEYKISKLLPLAVKEGLDIVALVMDSRVPLTVDEKMMLAMELVTIFNDYGIKNNQIILDPVVAPLGWENGAIYNKNNLEFLALVKEAISYEIRTMLGLSNLTTGSTGVDRSVKKLDSFYLSMAYIKGLDFALVNIFDKDIIKSLNFIKVLENKTIFTPSQFNE